MRDGGPLDGHDAAAAADVRGLDARCCGFHASFVTSRDDFEALAGEWGRLFDASGNGAQLFQTFAWCWHWYEATRKCGRGREVERLRILVLRLDGRAVLIWPLVERRLAGLRQLRWLGGPLAQYGDVLVDVGLDQARTIDQALNVLRSQSGCDLLEVARVRADSALFQTITAARGHTVCAQTALSLTLSPDLSDAEFVARFSSKARKNRRRQRRRLEERGAVSFQVLQGCERLDGLAWALDTKRRWLEDKGRVSRGLCHPASEDFLARLLAAVADSPATRTDGAHVFALTCNGERAAVAVALVAKDRLAVHILSHSPDFASMGVGALILEDIMSWARHRGVRICDLMAPADAYKREWCRKETAVCDHVVALSVKGRLWHGLRLSRRRQTAKWLVGTLPMRVRRLLVQTHALLIALV